MNNDDGLRNIPILTSSIKQTPRSLNWLPYLLMFFSTFIQAFGTFYAKFIITNLSNNFNAIIFLFIRSFSIVIGSYISFKMQNDPLLKPVEIPHKKWFILRANLSFFSLIFFIFSLTILRCSTTHIILTVTQLTATFVSIVFFHEKIPNSLLLGIFICGIGVVLVILNEFNIDNYFVILKGLFYSLISVILFSIVVLSNKKVSLSQISVNNHTFYQGLTTIIYSICYLLLTFQFHVSLYFMIMSLLHGVVFIIGQTCLTLATRHDSKNKVKRITHFQIIYVFLFSYFFLGEELYFTDWVGCIFIISFLVYHSIYFS